MATGGPGPAAAPFVSDDRASPAWWDERIDALRAGPSSAHRRRYDAALVQLSAEIQTLIFRVCGSYRPVLADQFEDVVQAVIWGREKRGNRDSDDVVVDSGQDESVRSKSAEEEASIDGSDGRPDGRPQDRRPGLIWHLEHDAEPPRKPVGWIITSAKRWLQDEQRRRRRHTNLAPSDRDDSASDPIQQRPGPYRVVGHPLAVPRNVARTLSEASFYAGFALKLQQSMPLPAEWCSDQALLGGLSRHVTRWAALAAYLQGHVQAGAARRRWDQPASGVAATDNLVRSWLAHHFEWLSEESEDDHDPPPSSFGGASEVPSVPPDSVGRRNLFYKHLERFRGAYWQCASVATDLVDAAPGAQLGPGSRATTPRARRLPILWEPADHATLHADNNPDAGRGR